MEVDLYHLRCILLSAQGKGSRSQIQAHWSAESQVCSIFYIRTLCQFSLSGMIPLVDCGIPEPSYRAKFDYSSTKEGSILTITCIEGLYLQEGRVEFVCNANGLWTHDPAGQYCYEEVQEPGEHTKHETNAHRTSVKKLSCFTSDSSAGVASGMVAAVVDVITVAVACLGIAVALVLVWKRKLTSKAIV